MDRKYRLAGVVAAALVACSPKPAPNPTPNPAPSAPDKTVHDVLVPETILDIDPKELTPCQGASLDYTSDIKIEISKVDLYNPQVTFQRFPHNATTPSLPINYGVNAGHTPPTQFDFELDYQGGPPTQGGKKSAALITVTVSDDTADIRTDPKDHNGNPTWAVTASGVNGPAMFCGPAVYSETQDPTGKKLKSITFTGKYDTHDNKAYGSFNLGLVVHNSPFDLPVFIDPNVKNNG